MIVLSRSKNAAAVGSGSAAGGAAARAALVYAASVAAAEASPARAARRRSAASSWCGQTRRSPLMASSLKSARPPPVDRGACRGCPRPGPNSRPPASSGTIGEMSVAVVLAFVGVLLALAVALGAQTMGFALGYSDAIFRAAALSGLLLAPLWTAWGLVELAGRTVPARFAARLVIAALTLVPGVILVLDPLNAGPFGKAWPGQERYMVLPRTALTAVHVLAVAIALLMMTLAALRTRNEPAWWDVFVPVAAAGAAVLLTVSLGLGLPNAGYPLLTAAAAATVWFAASRSVRVRLDELRTESSAADDEDWQAPPPGRRRRGRQALGAEEETPALSDDAMRDRGVADLAMGEPPLAARPTGDSVGGGGALDGRAGGDLTALRADGDAASRELAPPATSSRDAPGARVAPRLFGLIAIYTLAEGGGADFDRLAGQIVEAVHRNEPDTLLFVVHNVPKAPLQRIFYEVYRDRVAYAEHRRQPDVEEFFARHRPYVLATNVIELDLRYAKASALPSLATMFGRDNGP